MKPIVCIAGPTASGKSAWAIEIAKARDGEVINADALQVYSDLQVLSARPTQEDMQGIPHHLFGHIDGTVRYSVGQWVKEVQAIIIDVLARGKVPVLTGGTGLYFRALTVGLAQIPEPSEVVKAQCSQFLETQGVDKLRELAQELDPVATQRVLGADPHRLLRIVSVAHGTSKSLSEWQGNTRAVLPMGTWYGAVLQPDRALLYERINNRFDEMTENGGRNEARAMLERGLDPSLPIVKAIGLRELMAAESGTMEYERAIELSKRDTRRFAKRQMTWFRGQAKDWPIVAVNAEKRGFEENLPIFIP